MKATHESKAKAQMETTKKANMKAKQKIKAK